MSSDSETQTQILLADIDARLFVPTSSLPSANNGSTDALATHLGSLYLAGQFAYDSYDVGLSVLDTGSIPMVNREPYSKRKQLRKERVANLSAYVKF